MAKPVLRDNSCHIQAQESARTATPPLRSATHNPTFHTQPTSVWARRRPVRADSTADSTAGARRWATAPGSADARPVCIGGRQGAARMAGQEPSRAAGTSHVQHTAGNLPTPPQATQGPCLNLPWSTPNQPPAPLVAPTCCRRRPMLADSARFSPRGEPTPPTAVTTFSAEPPCCRRRPVPGRLSAMGASS